MWKIHKSLSLVTTTTIALMYGYLIYSMKLVVTNYFLALIIYGSYLESKPRHWSPNHSVVVKQIKDEKMIMGLYVTHIIIFENYEEKINRRSELVLELTRIFEQVAIRIYHVVPQEVQVSYVGSATSSAAPPPESWWSHFLFNLCLAFDENDDLSTSAIIWVWIILAKLWDIENFYNFMVEFAKFLIEQEMVMT